MEVLQRAPHILLTKYVLLVLCVHLCAALDHFSFYRGLKIKDIATTLPLSTLCACHSACKAMISCTAATHVTEPGSEPKCLISETLGTVKSDLARANADTHTTVIKEHQVKFVNTKRNFTAAKQACLDIGMRLATPSDAASLDLLAKIHEDRFGNRPEHSLYWMDITKTGDDKWVWGDGVPSEAGADPWGSGAPGGQGNCGVLYVLTYKLFDSKCETLRAYICTP